MSRVSIQNVVVMNNPCAFLTPFQYEITFDCMENLKEDLEWKIIYVGSAENPMYDQVLDTVLVGPLCAGRHRFLFQAESLPDTSKIPANDAIGVTVTLLTCSYKGQEFVRIGYFVNNEYSDPELQENPPTQPDYSKIVRNILATEPRVTKFNIKWDDSETQDLENAESAASSTSCGDKVPNATTSAQAEPQKSSEQIGVSKTDHNTTTGTNSASSADDVPMKPAVAAGNDTEEEGHVAKENVKPMEVAKTEQIEKTEDIKDIKADVDSNANESEVKPGDSAEPKAHDQPMAPVVNGFA